MTAFNQAQKAIYDEVAQPGTTLDQKLIALIDVKGRPDVDPEDIRIVRRWLSDQALRDTAR